MENLENEIWKDIPNYEGIYQASNKGRIRTCENKTTYTKKHGIRHWKQRILKPKGQTYATGYRVSLWKNGKQKDWLVARLVAMTFLGESNLTVNHIDGNRFNNNIENLEWATYSENIQHAYLTGLNTNQFQTTIINKKTNETKIFRTMSEASKYINKNTRYLSCKKHRGKTENKDYKWIITKIVR